MNFLMAAIGHHTGALKFNQDSKEHNINFHVFERLHSWKKLTFYVHGLSSYVRMRHRQKAY
jgi:hypothetical protein